MNRRFRHLLAIACLIVGSLGCAGRIASFTGQDLTPIQQDSTDAENTLILPFCAPKIETYLKEGRASFTVIFELSPTPSGRVDDAIVAYSPPGVELDLSECLRAIRLPSSRIPQSMRLSLRWEHAIGWTSNRYTMDTQVVELRPVGDLKPYG